MRDLNLQNNLHSLKTRWNLCNIAYIRPSVLPHILYSSVGIDGNMLWFEKDLIAGRKVWKISVIYNGKNEKIDHSPYGERKRWYKIL